MLRQRTRRRLLTSWSSKAGKSKQKSLSKQSFAIIAAWPVCIELNWCNRRDAGAWLLSSPVALLKWLAHFGEKFFVMVHNVLATDDGGEVHFNAVLSPPRSEVLEDLCITFSFEQTRHSTSSWCMDAKEHFKTREVVSLYHLAWIPQLTKTLVCTELSLNIRKNAVSEIHLHGWFKSTTFLF